MMENVGNLLDLFGRSFIFEKYREPLRQYFLKAGFSRTPYYAFGILFFVSVAITYALFLFFLPSLTTYSTATNWCYTNISSTTYRSYSRTTIRTTNSTSTATCSC